MLVKHMISAGAADFAGYVRSAWLSNRQRRSNRRRMRGPIDTKVGQVEFGLTVGAAASGVGGARWEDYSDLPEEAQQAGSVMLPAHYANTTCAGGADGAFRVTP